MRVNVGIAGEYVLSSIGEDGTRREVARFGNLVTTVGLEQMGSGTMDLQNARLGSGTAAPTVGDTDVTAPIVQCSVQSVSYSARQSSPYYGISTARYLQDVAADDRISSEVAVSASEFSTVFSRALIRNQAGDPAAVSYTSSERAELVYQLRLTPPTGDTTTTITESGTERTYVMRAADVTDPDKWAIRIDSFSNVPAQSATLTTYSGVLGEITSHPTTSIADIAMTGRAYVASSHEAVFVATLGPGDSNGTISALRFATPVGAFQVSVDPPIVKTSSFTVTFEFTVGWSE